MRILSTLLFLMIMVGCTDGPGTQLADDEAMPLVVEGWIEEGEAPMVMVTHAIDLTQDIPSFDDFVEKWGRITIYDDGEPYILTGHVNKGYVPSLVFTSSRLKGRIGHTYRLVIETENDYAEATVVMGPAPEITAVETVEELDGYSLNVDVERTDGVVQFRTRIVGSEERFYPAFWSTVPVGDIPEGGYKVTRGIRAAFDQEQADRFTHFFTSGQTVIVKVWSVPAELLPFWTAYDQAVSLNGNIFLNMPQNCRGNLEGALGYFSASGVSAVAVSFQ